MKEYADMALVIIAVVLGIYFVVNVVLFRIIVWLVDRRRREKSGK